MDRADPASGHVCGEDLLARPGAELRLVREFAAPPERVWRAWTHPEVMQRWLGPVAWPAIEVSADVRVGGRWRACLKARGGTERLWQSGRYLVVEPHRRLVFTFSWEGHSHEDGPGVETIVSVELAPTPSGGTRLSLVQRGLVSERSADGHAHGWASSLDRLDNHLIGKEEPR